MVSTPTTLTKEEILAKLPGEQEATILLRNIIESLFDYIDDRAYPVFGQSAIIELAGDGVPDASAKAELVIDPTGDNNSLTFTAVAFGPDGNNITIAYVDPEANDAELEVVVTGNAIVFNLATDSEGVITTTADLLKAGLIASAAASALVTAADEGVDDGSGVVAAAAAAPLEGGTGVGVGTAGTGSRYTDYTNGVLYLNTGDADEPVWAEQAAV